MKKYLKKLAIKYSEPVLYDFAELIPVTETTEVPIAAVSNKGLLINVENFKGKLSEEEQIGVIFHELLHLRWRHLDRKDMPDHLKANIATDIIINETLVNAGYHIPKFAVFRETYNVPPNLLTAKQVYDWLPEKMEDPNAGGELVFFNPDTGEVTDEKGNPIPVSPEMQEVLDEMKDLAKEADRHIGNITRSKHKIVPENPIPWDVDLNMEIGRLIKRDYSRTWNRPSRVTIPGIALPKYSGITYVPKIHVYVDTSGSMDHTLPKVVGALHESLAKLKEYQPSYFGFNTNIYPVKSIDELECGGGTEFKEVIGSPDLHIVITDGQLDLNYLKSVGNAIVYFADGTKITRQKL